MMYDPWTRLQPPLDDGSDEGESLGDWPPSPGGSVAAFAAPPARSALAAVDGNMCIAAPDATASVACPEEAAGGRCPRPPPALDPLASPTPLNEPALATVVDGVLAEAAVVAESVVQGAADAPVAVLRRELASLRARLALLTPAELGRFLDLKIQLALRAAAGEATGGGGAAPASAPVPVPKPKPAPAGARPTARPRSPVPVGHRRPWA